MELEDFFREFNLMLPNKVKEPTVTELISLLAHDNKCRFEFKCAAGLQSATRKGLAYWPFKIRAVQGHSEKAVQKAAASDTFNATLVNAGGGTVALSKVSLTGKPLATMEETPGVIYHRTSRGNWKGILESGFVPGGGDRVSSGRAHNYFSDKKVDQEGYVSGVRAQRPIEVRVAMREAVAAGLVFIRTTSDGILTKDVVPPQFIVTLRTRKTRPTCMSGVTLWSKRQEQQELRHRSSSTSPLLKAGLTPAPKQVKWPALRRMSQRSFQESSKLHHRSGCQKLQVMQTAA